MSNNWNRRALLQSSLAGSAVVTLPTFLVGCGASKSPAEVAVSSALTPAPANPFLEWFGIDSSIVRRVMTELTSRGADFADLYFQHDRSNSITLEDGKIGRASTSIDQGVCLLYTSPSPRDRG